MSRKPRIRQANPFEGLDGADLAAKLAGERDRDYADALMLAVLTPADLKNGGIMAHYLAQTREELIEALKDLETVNLIETDAYKVLLAIQTAIRNHRHVTAFLTNALTQLQSPPQAEDTESLDDFEIGDEFGDGVGEE